MLGCGACITHSRASGVPALAACAVERLGTAGLKPTPHRKGCASLALGSSVLAAGARGRSRAAGDAVVAVVAEEAGQASSGGGEGRRPTEAEELLGRNCRVSEAAEADATAAREAKEDAVAPAPVGGDWAEAAQSCSLTTGSWGGPPHLL